MANDYVQFAEAIAHLTPEEEAWLTEQLQEIVVIDGREYAADEANPRPADVVAFAGPRFLRDWENAADIGLEDSRGFDCYFNDGEKGADDEGLGRYLRIFAEEHGEPERATHFARRFLAKFRPDCCWCLTYAAWCDKLRLGSFGGGAVIVRADKIEHLPLGRFCNEARQERQDIGLPLGKDKEK